jgi:thiamine kinase-like enzyme
MEERNILEGGNLNEVVRVGETVRRPLKSWSPTIHRVLTHLEQYGFEYAPKFFGIDENNHEILSFIPGETAVEFPRIKPYMRNNDILADVARMLRKLHDITASFKPDKNDQWMLSYPGTLPPEVICHNDFAPYNVVFTDGKASGIIDFDTACPGPRIWDIAYTLYTFVPLGRTVYDPTLNSITDYNSENHAQERKNRIQSFFNVYRMNQPEDLIEQVVFRLEAMCNTLTEKAADGDKAFIKMIDEGHLAHYQNEIRFIQFYGHEWV